LPGYAIGGLAVGEPNEVMYEVIENVEPFMPQHRPRYLMGVGTPVDILEGVDRGVDFFDCVMPARNARHGHVFTGNGVLNLNNAKYISDPRPIENGCGCETCRNYSRAYIRHLLRAKEVLALRLCVTHNLYFYNTLMEKIRFHLELEDFPAFKKSMAGLCKRSSD
ncbi:MAG: tRNA guanosine(34) transglycosylase Tgt, partial [Eubacteriales bacterium]